MSEAEREHFPAATRAGRLTLGFNFKELHGARRVLRLEFGGVNQTGQTPRSPTQRCAVKGRGRKQTSNHLQNRRRTPLIYLRRGNVAAGISLDVRLVHAAINLTAYLNTFHHSFCHGPAGGCNHDDSVKGMRLFWVLVFFL